MEKIKERIIVYPVVIIIVTALFGAGLVLFAIKAGGAKAQVMAWDDQNRNGIRDLNEKGLPGACVNSGIVLGGGEYISAYYDCIHKTDANGETAIYFHVGPCWQIYNIVIPPDGYTPTTPNTSFGCKAEVGFTKGAYKRDESQYIRFVETESTKQKVLFWTAVLGWSMLFSESAVLIKRARTKIKGSIK